MATEDIADKPARAPRGAKPVTKAFFTALDAVPDAMRAAVAKAAQAMIRDQLKLRHDKLREAAAKEKARRPAAEAKPARGRKPAAPTRVAPAKAKRRTRKPAEAMPAV